MVCKFFDGLTNVSRLADGLALNRLALARNGCGLSYRSTSSNVHLQLKLHVGAYTLWAIKIAPFYILTITWRNVDQF